MRARPFGWFRLAWQELLLAVGSTPDATQSTLTADAGTMTANGTDNITFTYTPKDASGNTLTTQAWTATVERVLLSQAEAIVTAAPGTIADDGVEASTVSIYVEDADGHPAPNVAVTLSATGTGNTVTNPAARTGAAGTTTGSLVSTVAATKVVSAAFNGLTATDTASVVVSGTGPSLVFESNWSNSTGDLEAAVTDGGLWTRFGPALTDRMGVVTAASVDADTGDLAAYAGNVFRARTRDINYTQIMVEDVVPASTDHYIRYYTRNDAARRSDHGSCHNNLRSGSDEFQIQADGRYGGADDTVLTWNHGIQLDYSTYGWPNHRWMSPNLDKGVWYRIELYIEYNPLDGTQWRAWPRIYSLAGALLHDAADYVNSTPTAGLDAYYDVGGVDRWNTLGYGNGVSTAAARHIGIGLEGAADAAGYDPVTPAYTYWAAFAVSTSGWVGAY